jgi:TfoX/Sxy family transcriptional regulator of competence genes
VPYSAALAERVRFCMARERAVTEKKMFGGIGFLLRGHMCVAVWQNSLIARVGPEAYQEAVKLTCARDFDVTGRPMKGWIMIDLESLESDRELQNWIEASLQFVRTLPPKK